MEPLVSLAPRTHGLLRASELAEFHAYRMRVYACVARLLSRRPDERTIAELRAMFETPPRAASSPRAHRELDDALHSAESRAAAAEYGRLFESGRDSIDLDCQTPSSEDRMAAYAAALMPPNRIRTTELLMAAVLADRTSWALGNGDFVEAAALGDVQAKWLHREGRGCLGKLGADLQRRAEPFYRRVGRALQWQIEDDTMTLPLPEAKHDGEQRGT
jgi:TorA maturation chaperone TorD